MLSMMYIVYFEGPFPDVAAIKPAKKNETYK